MLCVPSKLRALPIRNTGLANWQLRNGHGLEQNMPSASCTISSGYLKLLHVLVSRTCAGVKGRDRWEQRKPSRCLPNRYLLYPWLKILAPEAVQLPHSSHIHLHDIWLPGTMVWVAGELGLIPGVLVHT